MKKKFLKPVFCALIILILAVGVVAARYAYRFYNGMTGIHYYSKLEGEQMKIACVGDSITYGYGVSNWPKNNYPKVLNGLLGEDYHVANFGVSGSCVNLQGDLPYNSTKEYEESLEYQPDILIFMLGTNDSREGNWIDEGYFMTAYNELLDAYLQGEALPKVYLCTCAKAFDKEDEIVELAAYGICPEQVEVINDCIRTIATERGYELIEMEELTAAHPEWFEWDGIHPDTAGTKEMAKLIAETIK